MSIQEMKNAILSVYKTKSWWQKVNRMYDDQIVAIYFNFNERGILGKTLRHERPVWEAAAQTETCESGERLCTDEKKEVCQQLSIFDFIN